MTDKEPYEARGRKTNDQRGRAPLVLHGALDGFAMSDRARDMSAWMLADCEGAAAALPSSLIDALAGKTILATGCSGFFGLWTLALLEAIGAQAAGVRLIIVSKDPQRFDVEHPRWARLPFVQWVQGGLGHVPNEMAFDFGLHMAASSDAASNYARPLAMASSMIASAAAMAQACAERAAPMLLVSSGAVYGKRNELQGAALEADDASSAPACLDARQAYGQAKRLCETLIAAESGLRWTVARPFAFLGAHLPLSTHFAAGNFLSDASRGLPIVIKGNGSPVRSYMHPADLAAWQLWLLARGPRGEAVNVGSDEAETLAQWARRIAVAAGAPPPQIQGVAGGAQDVYVPNLSKARSMGLRSSKSSQSALEESLAWLRGSPGEW